MSAPSAESLLPELELAAIHSSGPGGQNVNKVATAIQLRFDVRRSPSLDDELRARLVEIAGKRVSSAGILVITARRRRTQEGNRRDALDRLQQLLDEAAAPPPPERIPTHTPRAVKRRRVEQKRSRAALKRSRRPPAADD